MRDDDKEIEVTAEEASAVEDVDIDELEGDLKAKLKDMQKKLKVSEKEKLEYLTGWQRTKADFVNATRRAEEERSHVHKYASEGVIEDVIPVLDSFESALASKEVGQWRDGFSRIHSQLLSVLKSRGLEIIDQVHVPMDPRMHEAIQMSASVPEHPPNTVVGILQKGYKLHDKVLRPAKVIVTE
jgi:molecular chaperone GrpE